MAAAQRDAVSPAYRAQLDTLRAAAVTTVLVTHLLVPFGPAHQGVRLFFVISGFLITGILLKQRDESHQTLWQKLRIFYVRRSIRIWPIYYLTLGAAFAVNLASVRDSALWHFAYLSNFYYMKVGSWDPAVTGHLWSLSVEEQYYLLWPAIVLLIPDRRLVWVLAGGAATAVLYRWIMTLTSVAYPDIGTPAALDALCMGGALALAKHAGIPYRSLRPYLWSALISALVAIAILEHSGSASAKFVLVDFCFAVVFTAIVAAADHGVKGPLKTIFESRPILYIGRISYGIYLYHLFVAYVTLRAASYIGFDLPARGIATFLMVSALTIVAATISWFVVERPLASWKRRFPYEADRTTSLRSREQPFRS